MKNYQIINHKSNTAAEISLNCLANNNAEIV